MSIDNSAGKGTSGMDKFGGTIDRMDMKLGSKFLKVYKVYKKRLSVKKCDC